MVITGKEITIEITLAELERLQCDRGLREELDKLLARLRE